MTTTIDRILVSIEAKVESAINNIRAVEKALLGIGLAALFTGMAIKRFFQNLLTSLFQNFLLVEGETGSTNNAVNELLASLEFLKYSLVSAFVDSGAAQEWINRIQSLVDWFINLDDQTKSSIVSFSIWAVIIGSALMVLGQFSLAILGLTSLLPILKVLLSPIWTIFKGIASTLFSGGVIAGMVGLLAGLFGIFVLLPALLDRFGGFWNFLKAFGAGVTKLLFFALYKPIEDTIEAIDKLLGALSAVADAVGASGVSRSIGRARAFTQELQLAGSRFEESALAKIEDAFGVNKIRGDMINNITINGNADEGVIRELLQKLEEKIIFQQGSPQQ